MCDVMVRGDRNKRGFTLVELLVVISIIALLLSILMPSLQRAREAGQRIVCAANQRSILLSVEMYAQSNKDIFPTNDWIGDNPDVTIAGVLNRGGYIKNLKSWYCPSNPKYSPKWHWYGELWKTPVFVLASYGYNYQFATRLSTQPKRRAIVMGYKDASQTVQVLDASCIWFDSGVWSDPQAVGYFRGVPRHGNGYNFGYSDMHVEYVKRKTMMSHREAAKHYFWIDALIGQQY